VDYHNLISFGKHNEESTITADSDWGMLMRQPYVDSPSVQQLMSAEFLQRNEIKSSQTLFEDDDDDLLVAYSLLPSAYDDGSNYNVDTLRDDFTTKSRPQSFLKEQQYIWNQAHPKIEQKTDR
jgi:hypothetical protein